MLSLGTASELWSQAPRSRTSQRILQFAPTRFFIGLLALVPGSVVETLGNQALRTAWLKAGASLLAVALYLLGLWAFAAVVERRRPRELAISGAGGEWLAGFGLGLVLLGLSVGILMSMGAYRVETGGHPSALVEGLVLHVPHALFEELLFRVLLFKIAEESLGSIVALALQATVFGLIHLVNPGATVVGAVAIILEAGILLAVAYMLTRRVWLVWGLHVGWNLAQGSLFGIHVSGTPMGSSLLHSQPLGSDVLSGGGFGVEASPVAVLLCLAAAGLLAATVVRRGQVVHWGEQRRRIRELKQHVS